MEKQDISLNNYDGLISPNSHDCRESPSRPKEALHQRNIASITANSDPVEGADLQAK